MRFQFHSGSIKSPKIGTFIVVIAQFQFHSGSIKREYGDDGLRATRVFQFHSGSIKSVVVLIGIGIEPRFNSIVVRLKVRGRARSRLRASVSIP